MNFRLQALAIAVLSAAVSTAIADEAEIVYYDISGNTSLELRRELDAKGPLDGNDRVDGLTKWFVTWNFRYAPSTDGCRFTSISSVVTGTITLPRWAAGEAASTSLSKKWRSYLDALRAHEDGHYAHGIRAATEIKALGLEFRVPDNCASIAKLFNEQAGAIVEKYKAADVAYDSETRHGETQGAVFK